MNAEEIFARFLLPLYPAEARDPAGDDLRRLRTEDANPGNNPSILAHLDDAADRFVANARGLFEADLTLDRSDASVHRLSAALTRERRDAWAATGQPGTAQNLLFNAVTHGAAYVGASIVASHGGSWCVRSPLWESLVRLRSRAGEGELAVLHWWLKSLADDAQSTTLADRYRAHVEVPCERPEDLPLVTTVAPGALPRLSAPRYDRLHKYLRAHLPDVRDLGEHFPSPERFEAFAFKWLDFHVLGGGRMLLLAGATPAGLCLLWVSAGGFEKSAFLACDPFPDPIVRIEDGKIIAMTSQEGRHQVHEMLWWGP
jgi:hypothetical protein